MNKTWAESIAWEKVHYFNDVTSGRHGGTHYNSISRRKTLRAHKHHSPAERHALKSEYRKIERE